MNNPPYPNVKAKNNYKRLYTISKKLQYKFLIKTILDRGVSNHMILQNLVFLPFSSTDLFENPH